MDGTKISDVSGFSNYPAWWMYRQKARVMAIVIWALIVYIFILWLLRSVVHYNRYRESSHYMLLVDAVLVVVYVWFVMPYHTPSQNRFTGIKEMERQYIREKLEKQVKESVNAKIEDAINPECMCQENKKLEDEIYRLKQELAECVGNNVE